MLNLRYPISDCSCTSPPGLWADLGLVAVALALFQGSPHVVSWEVVVRPCGVRAPQKAGERVLAPPCQEQRENE
jgi:hypothetical protein